MVSVILKAMPRIKANYKKFYVLWEEYKKVKQPAWAEYEKVEQAAWDSFLKEVEKM